MKQIQTTLEEAIQEKETHNPTEMTWQQLLDMREKANIAKEEIEAGLSVVNEELLERLKKEKINGKVVGNWGISKATRYSFETTLEEAEALGAVKQTVDQAKLKKLISSGIKIPGTKVSEYVMVRQVEKKMDENGK